MIDSTHYPPLLTRNPPERRSDFTLAGISEIPFYGREFDVVLYTCPNPICDCSSIELYLYMPQALESNNYSFRIHGDAIARSFELADTKDNSGSAARILDLYLTPADWVTIEKEWRLSKAIQIEDLQPNNLSFSVKFPEEHRRNPSKLIAFRDIFDLCYPYQATFRGKEYWLIDLYCKSSNCKCTRVIFSFGSTEREFFAFWYNYKNRDIEILLEYQSVITLPEALQVVEYLNSSYPEFDSSIAKRNQILRALSKIDLKKRPDTKKIVDITSSQNRVSFIPTNVSRNEPCPCGSGKKFKRCCGK